MKQYLFCELDSETNHSILIIPVAGITALQSRLFRHNFWLIWFMNQRAYTVMLCPSSFALLSSLASSSVHTSPWHRVRHRNFIFGIHMHICPTCVHIKYLVIVTCSFQMAAILVPFFNLLSCLHR